MQNGALSDLTVLEFGNLVSAPYCGKLMADLGADVIKIEEPGIGDIARSREPFAGDIPGTERSGLFAYLNSNKLGITLNPRSETGKRIFEELVKQADILVENQPPRSMEKIGVTYPELEKINPMLIMTSITPFGQTGPFRDYKAYELNMYSSGGFGFISTVTVEEPVMPPVKAGGRQAQFGAGVEGAVASLCALMARDRIGAGQHVDISIQECLAGQYEARFEYWSFRGEEMGGLSTAQVMPIIPLPCKDGWVFLMCVEDREFDNLIQVMGDPDWAGEAIFKDRASRALYIDALMIFLTEWSMKYTMAEVFERGQAGHVPIGPAYTAEDVVNSEHLAARRYFIDLDHPVIGRARYPGAPYRLSESPWKIRNRPPLLGEHNEEIFCSRLGYTRKDLVMLTQAGVI
jgi:crotonobetainyl-CoA:carnitine CoA-transferase CaiB-like acyl-CoA transferase